MKVLKNLSMMTLLLAAALWTVSCGNADQSHEGDKTEHQHTEDDHGHDHDDDHAHDHDGEAHGEGAEFTSAYVCPMHCEGSGSDAQGTCPVCGMDYVAHADHVKDGHKH